MAPINFVCGCKKSPFYGMLRPGNERPQKRKFGGIGGGRKNIFGYCLQKISVPLIWSINWPKVSVSAPNNGQAQIFLNWRKEKGMREEEAAKGHPKGHPSFGTPSMGPYIIIPRLEKMPKKEVGESNRRVASIKSHLGGLNLRRFFFLRNFFMD